MILLEATEDKLEEIKNKSKVVMIDFWTPWCGPCKVMLATLQSIKFEHKDFTAYKMNVDENFNVTDILGLQSVPTIIFYVDGQIHTKTSGMKNKAWFEEQFKTYFPE